MATKGEEINRRAGMIADTVTGMLRTERVFKDALVVVTYEHALDWPLAIRTMENGGFGEDTLPYHRSYKYLRRQAKKQLVFSWTSGGRSADEQMEKLKKDNRTAPSYGVDLDIKLEPGFAIDSRFPKLRVAVVSKDAIPDIEAAHLAERAIRDVEKGKVGIRLDAAEVLYDCLKIINRKLPSDRTGVAMIALSGDFKSDKVPDNNLAVVSSQNSGRVVDPATFAIVEAKVRSVVKSGQPSSPKASAYLSRIIGAVPIRVEDIGQELVMGVGGLVRGEDDQLAIIEALGDFLPRRQISVLRQLS